MQLTGDEWSYDLQTGEKLFPRGNSHVGRTFKRFGGKINIICVFVSVLTYTF